MKDKTVLFMFMFFSSILIAFVANGTREASNCFGRYCDVSISPFGTFLFVVAGILLIFSVIGFGIEINN